ncbi:MAG: hypothetical protein JOS17DRAFT_688354, partial [Linnemannia elongata]
TDSEIDLGVSKQIIFRLEMQYGDVKWVIRRTLYEFYKLHLILSAKRFDNLPKFPSQVSYAFSIAKASLGMRAEEKINYIRQSNLARRQALQDYLIQVLQSLNWTIAYDLYEFLEISALSLTKDMGWKGKESYVDTKVTDNIHGMCGFGSIKRWNKNWALIRDSYLAFCPTVGSEEPSDVFIFDQTFYVQHKEHYLGLNMHHIEIGNSHRKIEIKGDHNREMLEWMDNFNKMKQSSPWVNSHRFGSFAPQRSDAKVRYYVDGKDYFHAVSDAILAAKTEIYICDWWLSPELEISLALTLDSAHTKIWLQDLHPNIQGLDLCFGRYDSRTHQLADYHPSGSGTIWPGQDYSNPRIKDFANVRDYNNNLIERKLLARMPWHDVSVGVAGQPARDIARHFVQRWNFVKLEKGMKKSHMKFLMPKGEFVSTRNESGWTGTQKVQILRSSTLWSQGVDLERSIQDAYLSAIQSAEHFIYIENQFFVTLAAENGHPDLKNKIGIALVERITRAHTEGKKFRVIVVMPLMPAFEADIMSSEAGTLRKVMHFQYVSICRGGNSVLERLVATGIDPDQYIGFYGLRSFDRIKHGKFDAIVEAVREAEERRKGNSSMPVDRPIVDNEVEDFVTEQLYIHSKLMIVDDRIVICGSANINDRSQVGFRDSEIAIIIEDTDMVDSRMNGEPYQAGKLAHALRTDLFKEHLGLLHHVDHDVVTKATVSSGQDPNKHPHPLQQHHEGLGYVQTYTPNVDETKAMEEWLSPNPDDAQGDAKKATAKDPEAASQIVMDPLHDSFYEGWWRPVAKTNTEIFREVFRCVPDDSVETWDEYRAFVPNPKKVLQGHVAMEGATVEQVTERLQRVTGHLVEFPTRFLSKENLMGGAVEGAVVPMEIFT